MPCREPSLDPTPESQATEGERLAAEGRAIEDAARALLADALAAVLADEAEVAALPPAGARDAVEFLVRAGRMTREAAEAVVRRAGRGEGPPDAPRASGV